MSEKNIIVFYDISDNKIRNKIVKILESYGIRMQKSVFQCEVNLRQFIQLKLKLSSIVEFNDGVSVVIIEVSNKDKVYYLDGKRALQENTNDVFI
ncbi:MAG: CRISPR-associated endonuclease Cas2 [Clostridia bacterium]|nr:CRISPR-associated endonuclease Cas2 [Clostridia bacterium]